MKFVLITQKDIENINIDQYLNQIEIDQYKAISPNKKSDWLSGRIALKLAFQDFNHDTFRELTDIVIGNLPNGRPYFTGFKNLYCSLGHSFSYGVGIVSDKPIGIDIEKIRPHNFELLKYIADNNEIELLKGNLKSDIITTIWVVKEAVMKGLGTGFTISPRQVKIQQIKNSIVAVEVLDNPVTGRSLWEAQIFEYHNIFKIGLAYQS